MIFVLACIGIIFLAYIALILSFIIGVSKVYRLNKLSSEIVPDKHQNLKISVVIPFRNEESNLENLVKNLANQTYSKDNYQLVLIDDYSTDNSLEIAKQAKESNPQIQIKILKSSNSGKKVALKHGILNADYDIIVTTDADCNHNKYWLSEIAKFQHKNGFDLIIASVKIETEKSIFGKFQEIEFLSLQASTIGSTGIMNPIMCNGANLIYKKQHFLESDLKNDLASGDDMFLLHAVKCNDENKIGYLLSENAIVKTNANLNIKQFFNQRIRWASKAKHYSDIFSKTTALLVMGTIIAQTMLLFFSFFNIIYFEAFLAIFLLKSIVDFILLFQANRIFKIKHLLIYILPFEIIYLIYSVTVGLLSLFSSSFYWKGRKYNY